MIGASKYRNIKVHMDGHSFDSKKEARRYGELKLLQSAGEISNLELQPKYLLTINGDPVLIKSKGYPNGRKASFKADFRYFCTKRNKTIVEDVKSPASRTEAYALRKAVVEAIYPGVEIVEI